MARQRCAGLGWDDVLPYFLRSEDNCRGASEFHSTGGEMVVTEQRSPRRLNRLLEACEAAGIPRTADYNGPEQDGASMFQVNQRGGRRWSAADAFLRPVLFLDAAAPRHRLHLRHRHPALRSMSRATASGSLCQCGWRTLSPTVLAAVARRAS